MITRTESEAIARTAAAWDRHYVNNFIEANKRLREQNKRMRNLLAHSADLLENEGAPSLVRDIRAELENKGESYIG